MEDAVTIRQRRNSNVLELKKQEIERKYASGKVRLNIRGTEEEMTRNTILAIPTSLITREGVIPAKGIKIDSYNQAGPNAQKLGSVSVGLQRNMVDLDEAIEHTLATGERMSASNVRKKPVDTNVSVEETDFGITVRKPTAKTEVKLDAEFLDHMRSLLGEV